MTGAEYIGGGVTVAAAALSHYDILLALLSALAGAFAFLVGLFCWFFQDNRASHKQLFEMLREHNDVVTKRLLDIYREFRNK